MHITEFSGYSSCRPNWLTVMPRNKKEFEEIERRMAELERTIDKMAGPDEELAFLGRGEESLESAAKYLIERSLQGASRTRRFWVPKRNWKRILRAASIDGGQRPESRKPSNSCNPRRWMF